MLRIILLILCTFWCTGTLFAQKKQKAKYSVELGGFYSINNTIPFWLRSNQFGAFPNTDNTVLFRQNLESRKDTSKANFKTSYCFDMVLFVGSQAKIIIPEAFYRVDYKKFALTVGRRKQVHGLVDSTLSSGSITWSGNALPLPEIQLSVPEYTKVLFPFLSFKGHFSHAWFGNQTSVRGYYLHQKSLYGRIGRPNSKVKLYGGILHHAQWGGTPKYGIPDWDTRYVNGKFPTGWYVYRNILLPFTNPSKDSLVNPNTSPYDYENRYGNHLGQIDMGGELILKKLKMLFYKQIIFETGQTFSSLTNIDDGLYGISISSLKPESKINKVVFEFLQTTNQGLYRSGFLRLIGFQGKHYGRNQNFYFNHGQYFEGWSYNGLTIGSPFLIPNPDIRYENKDNGLIQLYANNNNIKAGYIGMSNKLNTILLESRMSFSRNYGTGNNPLKADQFSIATKAAIPAPKLKGIINVGVGIEQGDLIYDNYGAFVSFKKIW
ncbi:capsule assembly Wzi family protein [Lacihabitans soyangensis]|uniref:capsule assembly Wzi family protein n=1 Tax=Lacihabitans soyangensis TaxID=869394 RepID=UPI0020CC8BD9|nr:capsule assembly Wzi family protein [Lacihabitans soyangensis]